MTALRSPLKWAGGKTWLLPTLRPLWRDDYRLVEPFCGGLAVAIGLRPTQGLFNDANPHLINFMQWLQRGLIITNEMIYDRVFYYARREEFNALIRVGQHQTQRAAELFYYLNRTGFNGLCRFNRNGLFNVPFGRYKTIHYTTDFRNYQTLLADWEFRLGDFSDLPIREGDWIYADPPYDTPFTQYSQTIFTWTDQVRLAHWLAQQCVPVITSNQATDRILALYHDLGFEVRTLLAPRLISANGDRRPALEILAFRNLELPTR
ncbi:MAG: Dam family site-specific DNA-(adenine-N6)-methyltransferase [Anaerolineae bacterium]|jgi:DNA adenine methylase|nr:Dam family site-specific DNA-(adenine-N6)-methyltransferase [Anaerolineae bacterium]